MDPNAALQLFRDSVRMAEEADTEHAKTGYLIDAARAMEGLDEWLSKGGFLPAAWNIARG